MYTLRDSPYTYQACHAADVRRPRMSYRSLDPRWAVSLARSMCRDDDNRLAIESLVKDAVGHVGRGADLHERFSELVICGRIVLNEVMPPDVYPLSDPAFEPPVPLVELDPVEPEQSPRTWLSIELVHSAGLCTETVELEVLTADGREVYGRIDARGTWRSEDIDPGTCTVRLLEHPVLARQPRSLPRTQLPREGEIAWVAGSEPRLDLRTAAHHRIVIMQPPQHYCLSA
ncbi:MAG: hypothetical protein AAF799_29025 [Myxococcota bacterium]